MMDDNMIAEENLTPHFTLFELTQTTHDDLQRLNRIISWDQIQKLKLVALLLEEIRAILDVPMTVHSGYRCPALNKAVGSSVNSQHLKCEAADFVPETLLVREAFAILRTAAKVGKFSFGQLILEKQDRSYGVQEWIHVSLGVGYRDPAHCGQIMTMNDGQYQLLEQIGG